MTGAVRNFDPLRAVRTDPAGVQSISRLLKSPIAAVPSPGPELRKVLVLEKRSSGDVRPPVTRDLVDHTIQIEPDMLGGVESQLVEDRILPAVPVHDHEFSTRSQIAFDRVEHRRGPLEMMVHVQH